MIISPTPRSTLIPACGNSVKVPAARQLTAGRVAGVPSATRRCFRRGDFLAEAGCQSDAIYVIRAGHVRTFLLDEDGRETSTAILGPGHVIGLAPFFGRAAHGEFAQALGRIETWSVPVTDLAGHMGEDVNLLGRVLGTVAQRFALALALYRAVTLLPVAERARDIEARLSACFGGSRPILNRTTLAGFIQARPETLARTNAKPRGSTQPPVGGASEQQTINPGVWSFGPGQAVLQSDLPAGYIGRVVSGQVQVSLSAASARTVVVDVLEAGDFCSIGSLFGSPPVGLHVMGLSDGAFEVLRASDFLQRVSSEPHLLESLLVRFGMRLERLEHRLSRSAGADSSQHLIELLREVAPPDGQTPSAVPGLRRDALSHVWLARQMGVCRETVTRALAVLEEAGAIRREGRRIMVLAHTGNPDPSSVRRDLLETPRGGSRAALNQPPESLNGVSGSRDVAAGDNIRKNSQPVQAATSNAVRGAHGSRMPGQIRRRPSTERTDDAAPTGAVAQSRQTRRVQRHAGCRLCGLRVDPPVLVCAGCAERLELEMDMNPRSTCPDCGRHQELCRVTPCGAVHAPRSSRAKRTRIAWLPLELIDEPPTGQNSRKVYDAVSIAQLAASIREYGLLQPVCVRPTGARYQLVFGARRLRAAVQAGLQEVPCTVQVADDDRAFLLNTLENLHRRQLTGAERVKAIERLAATGLGVREIGRRTGFNPSTISRWLRINGRAELKAALIAGTVDICRATILVEAPRPMLVCLIEQASSLSPNELRARVAALKLVPVAGQAEAEDVTRLQTALRSLQAVRTPDHLDIVEHIHSEVLRLLGESSTRREPCGATA